MLTPKASLAFAAFAAFAVLPTQLAHFWAVDPYLTFFATAALVLCFGSGARADVKSCLAACGDYVTTNAACGSTCSTTCTEVRICARP